MFRLFCTDKEITNPWANITYCLPYILDSSILELKQRKKNVCFLHNSKPVQKIFHLKNIFKHLKVFVIKIKMLLELKSNLFMYVDITIIFTTWFYIPFLKTGIFYSCNTSVFDGYQRAVLTTQIAGHSVDFISFLPLQILLSMCNHVVLFTVSPSCTHRSLWLKSMALCFSWK